MEDINRAGGVNAVMKEMTKRGDDVLLDNLTIGGETLFEKSPMPKSRIPMSFEESITLTAK
jgi:dihydroxyacid dehydratase/phosphogluconate dehydratase